MRVRSGTLPLEERATYDKQREDLARTLLAMQRLNLRAGETPRCMLRVNRALYVDLFLGNEWSRGTTLDLSTGGFAVLLTGELGASETIPYCLHVPDEESIRGISRVLNARPQGDHARVSFAFDGLAPKDVERLEMLIFDTVLLNFDKH